MLENALKIRELHFEKGYSLKEVAELLNVSINTVKRVASKKYDKIIENDKMKKHEDALFEEKVKEVLPSANSLNHICSLLGLRGVHGYYVKIQKVIDKYNLSTNHFGTIKIPRKTLYRNKFTSMPNDEFFIAGKHRNGKQLIKRLVENGIKEYKCEECGIKKWNGKPIVLQIHHINGDHNDNRIENLQLLCPNCHSQTSTYARANAQKKVLNAEGFNIIGNYTTRASKQCEYCGRVFYSTQNKYCSHKCAEEASRKITIDKNQLLKDFEQLKSYRGVSKKYNISDNGLRKYCKRIGVFDIVQNITKRKYDTHITQ